MELRRSITQEPAAKFRQPGGGKRESSGGPVASEAREKVRHGFKRFQKVKGRDATPRSVSHALFFADCDDHCRAIEALDESGCHDTQDAPMPTFPSRHDR